MLCPEKERTADSPLTTRDSCVMVVGSCGQGPESCVQKQGKLSKLTGLYVKVTGRSNYVENYS